MSYLYALIISKFFFKTPSHSRLQKDPSVIFLKLASFFHWQNLKTPTRKFFVSGKRMLISSKGHMDPFVAWHMMKLSSEIWRWIRHAADSWSLQIAVFSASNFGCFSGSVFENQQFQHENLEDGSSFLFWIYHWGREC